MKKEGWEVPPVPRGYITLRDARLSDQARDLFEMWTRGDYEYDLVVENLKKLERPVPGIAQGKTRIAGMIGYQNEADEGDQQQEQASGADQSHINAIVPAQDATLYEDEITFVPESLYVTPDSFDDDLLEEAFPHLDNDDILYVSGDLTEDMEFDEEEAVAIFANYKSVRKFLHARAKNRGFFKTPVQKNQKIEGNHEWPIKRL